jgi:hypothetical protein
VLDFSIIGGCGKSNLEESIYGRVSDNPVQSLQNVPFHLGEHFVIVKRAAHRFQLPNGGYAVLFVAILGSNEKRSTSDELVMALVYDTAGAVAVEEINGKEECLGQELESGVSFDQEVEEVGTHEPLDLCLNVNRVDVWQSL